MILLILLTALVGALIPMVDIGIASAFDRCPDDLPSTPSGRLSTPGA